MVPLLITDLLSCIFAIEDGNVILKIVGLFCMLYKACNTGLRWVGCKSPENFPLLNCFFICLLMGMLSLRWKMGGLTLRLLPVPLIPLSPPEGKRHCPAKQQEALSTALLSFVVFFPNRKHSVTVSHCPTWSWAVASAFQMS